MYIYTNIVYISSIFCLQFDYVLFTGHEGEGSLIQYLREKVWALSLYAGCEGTGFEMNETYSQFAISIILTEKGFAEYDQVMSTIFSYLKILKSEGKISALI